MEPGATEEYTRISETDSPPVYFERWRPPKDPDRPPFPYLPGLSMKIQRHVPPPPFGDSRYHPSARPSLTREYLSSVTQSELVLAHPPLETSRADAHVELETAQVTIDSPIAIGGARGAQVVACTILTGEKPFKAVAKIYDALYYSFSTSIGSFPVDSIRQADADYSREAAAYAHLDKAGQTGNFAPLYFGSWTFDLPITRKGVPQTRPVRMVLIEHLSGHTLRSMLVRNDSDVEADVDAFHYPEGYRLEILAQAVDGLVRQAHAGIDQKDFATRNVMLVDRPEGADEPEKVDGLPLPRVVLVDYNHAVVFELSKAGKSPKERLPLPYNPMLYFWRSYFDGLGGWVPHEWYEDPRMKQAWLKQRLGDKKHAGLYAPVTKALEYSSRPAYRSDG